MKKLHHIYFSTALLTLLAPAAGQSASFLPPHSTSFNIADSASLLKSKISLNSIGDASILRLDPKVLASEDDFFANNLVIKSADKTYPMVENAKKLQQSVLLMTLRLVLMRCSAAMAAAIYPILT